MKTDLPQWINLCGIGYVVEVRESLIIFREEITIYGCHTVLYFERTDLAGGGCWLFRFSASSENVMASHIAKAYEAVQDVYGKNFEEKQPL